MNRRDALTTMGVTAAGLATLSTAATAAAQEKKDDHHAHFAACAKACADCQLQCDMCFAHCKGLLAAGKKEHETTPSICVDCAECCKLGGHPDRPDEPARGRGVRVLREVQRQVRRGVREVPGRQAHGRLRQVLPGLRQGVPGDDPAPEALTAARDDCRVARCRSRPVRITPAAARRHRIAALPHSEVSS